MKGLLPVSSRSPRWGTALALLLLLLAMLTTPFLPAQSPPHQPSCCMDAQHCSLHLHRAASQGQNTPHLASVAAHCPCTPLAPTASTTHGVPLHTSALHATAVCSQAVAYADRAHHRREPKADSAAPRAPPVQPVYVLLAA